MKGLFLVCALLIVTTAIAQQQKPEVLRPDAQSQQEIAEAQRQANEARLIYEAAQQKVLTVLYKAMADVGCPSKQCQVKQDRDGVFFEKTKVTDSASVEKKP